MTPNIIHMSRYLGFKAQETDNYYFISYNSNDSERIASDCLKMHEEGIPLWYDEGLNFGDKWEEKIGEKIANALALIFFFTVGMLEKEDSYALKEYRIAKKQGKQIIVLLVDQISGELWSKFPKKCSLLDDLDQTHSSLNIESLIKELKAKTSGIINGLSETTKPIDLNGPVIVDSEYLLNNSYFTALQISKIHVDLDYLTIDANQFPEALDVEGDAQKWESMITDTADCSANLIINKKIVGYLDFFPVSPENYTLLKTKPFTEDYVAFYTFGGRFDIFVSMFSINPNYATPNNIILFIQWIIKRILFWKESDINIGKIEFSLYSKHQAKVLEILGFKLTLTSKLKGMLYEARVSDLLSNRLITEKLSNSKIPNYEYFFADKEDTSIIQRCMEIATSLHVKNGGILQYENAVIESDILIYAKYINKVVGYVCLKQYDVFENGLYVEQIAVTTNHQKLGIGKTFIKMVIQYAKANNYHSIYANCKKTNSASRNLFLSCGFNEFYMSKEEYLGIGIEELDISKNIALSLQL